MADLKEYITINGKEYELEHEDPDRVFYSGDDVEIVYNHKGAGERRVWMDRSDLEITEK